MGNFCTNICELNGKFCCGWRLFFVDVTKTEQFAFGVGNVALCAHCKETFILLLDD